MQRTQIYNKEVLLLLCARFYSSGPFLLLVLYNDYRESLKMAAAVRFLFWLDSSMEHGILVLRLLFLRGHRDTTIGCFSVEF